MLRMFETTTAITASLLLAACSQAGQDAGPAAPAPAPDSTAQAPAEGPAMVAAANPLAVEAGLEALRNGGDAVDAAIAVQAVLGLVEPQSSRDVWQELRHA